MAAFGYRRASSLDDALAALADGDAKVIAGGMSLLPLMKLRLASPDVLVDIGGLSELRAMGPTADGGLEIGALVTYAEVLANTQLPIAVQCIYGIGDIQVRNRGTVGGAISHADPASDLPALGLALDYSAVLRSSRGERTVPLDGFFEGPFQTGIAADEILVKMVRGPLPAGAGGGHRGRGTVTAQERRLHGLGPVRHLANPGQRDPGVRDAPAGRDDDGGHPHDGVARGRVLHLLVRAAGTRR